MIKETGLKKKKDSNSELGHRGKSENVCQAEICQLYTSESQVER